MYERDHFPDPEYLEFVGQWMKANNITRFKCDYLEITRESTPPTAPPVSVMDEMAKEKAADPRGFAEKYKFRSAF